MSDTDCVRQFMMATSPEQVPSWPGMAVRDDHRVLRARLVLSEALELCEALGVRVYASDPRLQTDADLLLVVDRTRQVDHVEAADACADLRYVVVGTEIALGLPGDAVFAEVHRSNMTKVSTGGEVLVDDGGKVLKPPGWSAPDVRGVLDRHLQELTR